MSGRKVTPITLDVAVRTAVRLQGTAEDARTRARSIVTALTARIGRSGAPSAGVAALRRRIGEIEERWPEETRRLTVSRAQRRAEKFRELGDEFSTVASDARAMLGAADVRAATAAVSAEVEARDSELRPWLGDRWDDFAGRVRGLLAQADQAIRSGRGATDRATVERLAAELDELLQQVAADRQEAAEREHVAAAIEEVGGEMGYAVTRRPLEAPQDDLVLDIDTYAYGRIQVRLEFGTFTAGAVPGGHEPGGITWRSESAGLSRSECGTTFPDIAERLRRLGVGTRFTYEQDGQPVQQARAAATPPLSTPVAATQGADR